MMGRNLAKFLMLCAAIAVTAAVSVTLENDTAYSAAALDRARLASTDARPTKTVSEFRRLCSGFDADAAIAACTQLIQSGKESAKSLFVEYYNRGSAWFRKSDFDRAIGDYSEAAGLNPADPDSFVSIGRAFDAKNDDDLAIQSYTRAIALDPANATAFRNRGDAYFRKNDTNRAVRDYNQAIKLNPNDELAQSGLVSAQLKLLPYP